MAVKSASFQIEGKGNSEIENITRQVQDALSKSELQAGILTVFIKHTTASVMIIEDEPGIRQDTKSIWHQLIPPKDSWSHNLLNEGENNGHSHLRGQLQGQSVTVPFNKQTLVLGRWQQLVMIDFDTRPRTRELIIQLIGE